jgi:hypothetical protein
MTRAAESAARLGTGQASRDWMRCRSEPVTRRNDCPWPAEREPIHRLYKGGTGILKIAKTLGVGTSVVQGVVRPSRAQAQAREALKGAGGPDRLRVDGRLRAALSRWG